MAATIFVSKSHGMGVRSVNMDTVEMEAELSELKRKNPQGYGYLTRYWKDAKQGLDNATRNYAQVGHIYENIPESQIGTRGLGQTLSVLAELNVLTVLTDRSNATIYNLTSYDPDRLTTISRFLNSQ